MAIARRGGLPSGNAIAVPGASGASVEMPAPPPVGSPLPMGDAPAPDAVAPAGRLRRCTYRRVDAASPLPGRTGPPVYELMCLYGDALSPLPLGDVDAARPICEACTATGIFRPDED